MAARDKSERRVKNMKRRSERKGQADTSVRGRICFLQAVSFYCPGFFESLRDDVLNAPDRYFFALASNEETASGARAAGQKNFESWLEDWGVKDRWIEDACSHTLQAWAIKVLRDGKGSIENVRALPVFYGPEQPVLAKALREFKPVLDSPFPLPKRRLQPEDHRVLEDAPPTSRRMYEAMVERESSAEFKKRMRVQFESQLSKYTDEPTQQILLDRRNQRRDAEWTALFHLGMMTPKKIESWEFKRSGEAFSYARIQQVIKTFAKNIDLTLRPPKAGRSAKGLGVKAGI